MTTRLELTLGLSGNQRETYGLIADVLICEADGMPSATQVDVHTRWIDDALRLRPDLREGLNTAIEFVRTAPDLRHSLGLLAVEEPDVFTALGTLTAGAYYMDDRVRELMGYPGQEERRLVDDTEEYLDMLERVVDRGPVYRPTPA